MREKRIKQFEIMKEHMVSLNIKPERSVMLDLKNFKSNNKNSEIQGLEFFQENVIATLFKFSNPLVLVYGSAHKAGGGVLNGAKAQEEDLSMATTWYFHVKDNEEYYKKEHSNLLYSSDCLYVKNSFLLTNEFIIPTLPKNISMLGAAAPNLSGMVKSGNLIDENLIYSEFQLRLEGMFNLAENFNHKIFILGDWGCGVFGLDTVKVANIYKKVILKKLYSGRLVFSIMDREHYFIFKSILEN
jgi:uncharacterized protein (TIGR02452 family)